MDERHIDILGTCRYGCTGNCSRCVGRATPFPVRITRIEFRAAHHDDRSGYRTAGCRQDYRGKCRNRSSDRAAFGRIAGTARRTNIRIQ